MGLFFSIGEREFQRTQWESKIMNFKSFLAILLSYLISPLPSFAAVQAAPMMITTQELVEEMNRQQAEAIINEQLDRGDIQKELEKLGVSAEDAKMRLASLTDSEITDIAIQMEAAQYGGITSILVLIILILLIIYLAKKI